MSGLPKNHTALLQKNRCTSLPSICRSVLFERERPVRLQPGPIQNQLVETMVCPSDRRMPKIKDRNLIFLLQINQPLAH